MGLIQIKTWGSFPTQTEVFSAMESGHAVATEDAIRWLDIVVLGAARQQDENLRVSGCAPHDRWKELDKRIEAAKEADPRAAMLDALTQTLRLAQASQDPETYLKFEKILIPAIARGEG